MQSNSIKSAAALLRANGVTLRRDSSGEYLVRLLNSPAGHGYYATDLDDAVATGLAMASDAARLQELAEIDAANGVSFAVTL